MLSKLKQQMSSASTRTGGLVSSYNSLKGWTPGRAKHDLGLAKLPAELLLAIIAFLPTIDLFALKLCGNRHILDAVRTHCSSLKPEDYLADVTSEMRQRWENGPCYPISLAAARGQTSTIEVLTSKESRSLSVTFRSLITDKNGKSALHWAAECGQDAAIRLLLKRFAYPEHNRTHMALAVSLAAANGHESTVKLLLREGLRVTAGAVLLAAEIAAKQGHKLEATSSGITNTVLSWTKNEDNEFFSAVKKGKEFEVRRLIHAGADVNQRDYRGRTALSHAATNGHKNIVRLLLRNGAESQLARAAAEGDADTVQLLLRMKAPVGDALQEAAYAGQLEIVQMLLDHGADINNTDSAGNYTALHSAATMHHASIVSLLLSRGASLYPDPMMVRVTALHLALYNSYRANGASAEQTISLLVTHEEATSSRTSTTGGTTSPQPCRGLMRRAEYGRTVLHVAAESPSRTKFIRFFLDHGADIESRDFHRRTPLLVAALEHNLEAIKILLDAGADVHAADSQGMTVLHFTYTVAPAAYALLVERGASPGMPNQHGRDPAAEYYVWSRRAPFSLPFVGQSYKARQGEQRARDLPQVTVSKTRSLPRMPCAHPFEKGILDASRFL